MFSILPAARRFALQRLTTRHGFIYWEVACTQSMRVC